jgi:hypothetical protein
MYNYESNTDYRSVDARGKKRKASTKHTDLTKLHLKNAMLLLCAKYSSLELEAMMSHLVESMAYLSMLAWQGLLLWQDMLLWQGMLGLVGHATHQFSHYGTLCSKCGTVSANRGRRRICTAQLRAKRPARPRSNQALVHTGAPEFGLSLSGDGRSQAGGHPHLRMIDPRQAASLQSLPMSELPQRVDVLFTRAFAYV